jgi:hypothetical protein
MQEISSGIQKIKEKKEEIILILNTTYNEKKVDLFDIFIIILSVYFILLCTTRSVFAYFYSVHNMPFLL